MYMCTPSAGEDAHEGTCSSCKLSNRSDATHSFLQESNREGSEWTTISFFYKEGQNKNNDHYAHKKRRKEKRRRSRKRGREKQAEQESTSVQLVLSLTPT